MDVNCFIFFNSIYNVVHYALVYRGVSRSFIEPVKKPKTIEFDTLSVEELTEYIEELKAEIKKAHDFIESKEKDRLDAENLFKK